MPVIASDEIERAWNCADYGAHARKLKIGREDIALSERNTNGMFADLVFNIIKEAKEKLGEDVAAKTVIQRAHGAFAADRRNKDLSPEEVRLRWGELRNAIHLQMTGETDESESLTDDDIRNKTVMNVLPPYGN